jgi:hypothetical protein
MHHEFLLASGANEKIGGGAIASSPARPSVARMTYEMDDTYMQSEKAGSKRHGKTGGAVAVVCPPDDTKQNQDVTQMKQYEMEAEVEDSYKAEDSFAAEEVEDSYVKRERVLIPAVSRSMNKAGALRVGSTAVGAVAVAGHAAETQGSELTTNNESSYDYSQVNQASEAGPEVKSTGGDKTPDEPIEAMRVEDSEADIEAQLQSHMQKQAKDIAHMVHKELMTNAAIPVDVQPNIQDTTSVSTRDYNTEGNSHKKRNCLIAVILLVIVAAIGAGVGVAVSNKPEESGGPDQPPTSPPTPVTTQAEVLQDFLEPLSGEQLKDTNSPQFQALTWLANIDVANLTVGVESEDAIKARYVAAVLYYAFSGDNWSNKYRFLSERDVCAWNQRFSSGSRGITCGSDGTVESFQLRECSLPIVFLFVIW